MKGDFTKVHDMMADAVGKGVFQSASLLVGIDREDVFIKHYGGADSGCVFDVASLTKPVVTATLAMSAAAKNLIRLEDAVGKYLPAGDVGRSEIFRLLDHSSGLPAYQPFYREVPLEDVASSRGREQIVRSAAIEPLEYKRGEKSVYSDIGFIILGDILERVLGAPLHFLSDEMIFKPVGMKNSFFRPVDKTPWSGENFLPAYASASRELNEVNFLPTEDCPWRGVVVHGYPHDQNCYAMGGVAGHAGLFSNVYDLSLFVRKIVSCLKEDCGFIPREILNQFIDDYSSTLAFSHPGTHLLGWDRPAHANSQAGRRFSEKSIGHLGYTGCSLWIDLARDFWIILLTNRTYPSSTNERIKCFRPILHDAIVEQLFA